MLRVRVADRMAKWGRRPLFLEFALLGFGASMMTCCVAPPAPPQPVAASIQRPQQPAPKESDPVVPHPARKPNPPSAIEGAESESPGSEDQAPEAAGQTLAMIPPEGAQPGPGTAVAVPPRTTVSAPPQAKELIGLDQPAATRLLGTAAERAEEPPATVWRYKTANCELDLYFYLDLRSGRMRTLHYTFKGDATDAVGRQSCLTELAAARGS
jgi:hypothetical protein